jgi:spartin
MIHSSFLLFQGAHYISHGLLSGAEKVGALMDYGTPKLIQKITPEPVPQPVNPKLSRGLQVAKDVTETAVQITGFMGENQSFHIFKCVLLSDFRN